MKKDAGEKIKNTAKNKIRRIEKELKLHPLLMNNRKLLERLEFWKTKR